MGGNTSACLWGLGITAPWALVSNCFQRPADLRAGFLTKSHHLTRVTFAFEFHTLGPEGKGRGGTERKV